MASEPSPSGTGAQQPAGAGPRRRRRSFLRSRTTWLVAGAVVLALVAGLVGGIVGRHTGRGKVTASCNTVQVADTVLPALVTLAAQGSGAAAAGTGSGQIIRADGYILTNEHVLTPALSGGGSIQVLLSDGEQLPATVVGHAALVDLAVVKVQRQSLSVISYGSSAGLRVGQPVVALGAPLGLSGTVTAGIVSALGRDVSLPPSGGQQPLLVEAVQTDAAINPGNSGGPLVDCRGRLVGVNTAGAAPPGGTGSVGLGFAIPGDFARRVADEIIATGSFTPGYLGISAIPIPEALAHHFGGHAGLAVRAVVPDSPAQRAGLAVGDIITTVDNTPATSADDLLKITLTRHSGDQVTIGYVRDGQAHTTTLTVGVPPR
jgi:putative serine protease PepD